MLTHLLVDEARKIGRDDLVHVTVAHDETVAVGYRKPGDAVAVLGLDERLVQWAEMEEYDDRRRSNKLANELVEHNRGRLAGLVEEYTKALHRTHQLSTETLSELQLSIRASPNKVGGGETVTGFCKPLVLFAKSPKNEDRSKKCGQEDREPRTVWHLDKCR